MPTLSGKEHIVLELLGRSSEMYGLELVTESAGALKRGTVYVTLGRMEDKGYVTSRAEEESPAQGGLPRRWSRANPYGCELLAMLRSARRRLAVGVAR